MRNDFSESNFVRSIAQTFTGFQVWFLGSNIFAVKKQINPQIIMYRVQCGYAKERPCGPMNEIFRTNFHSRNCSTKV